MQGLRIDGDQADGDMKPAVGPNANRGVKLRTSGTIEATGDLGETQRDERYQRVTDDDDDDAVVAGESLYACGKSKDSRANRHVDRL